MGTEDCEPDEVGGQIKVSSGRQSPGQMGNGQQANRPPSLGSMADPALTPAFKEGSSLPDLQEAEVRENGESKGSFHLSARLNKSKIFRQQPHVSHKLWCSRGRENEQRLRHRWSGSVQAEEGHNYLTEGIEVPKHDRWVTAQQMDQHGNGSLDFKGLLFTTPNCR